MVDANGDLGLIDPKEPVLEKEKETETEIEIETEREREREREKARGENLVKIRRKVVKRT